jgi:transposase
MAIGGQVTNREAARALGLSRRQVQRLKRRVERDGVLGVVHGKAGRQPANKTPEKIREKAIRLAQTDYAEFNFSHLAEMLAEEHDIELCDQTLRFWLRALGHGRPRRRLKKHRRRRERKPREGEMLFLDGSPHRWLGEEHPACCLLLCSDDATGKPLWGKFQATEDRDGCFEVAYEVFRRFGLPGQFYLDRASQFTTTRHGGLHVTQGPDTDETHFERAMHELAVATIFADSPQARGRAERLNGSFQDRLVAELAYKGITDYQGATRYVNRIFIPKYARRFGNPPADTSSAWRPVPAHLELGNVLCARYTRTVANDTTVSMNGRAYQLSPPPRCLHLAKAQIEVRLWFDGTIHFSHPRYGELKARPVATSAEPHP